MVTSPFDGAFYDLRPGCVRPTRGHFDRGF
jgi:hypothetical protein